MSTNRAALAAAAIVVFQAADAFAGCEIDGWWGTLAGITARPEDGRVGWQVGNELGASPLGVPVSPERCLRLGAGLKGTYDGHWGAALPIRVSVGDRGLGPPSFYVQAGVAGRRGTAGADAEAGIDWIYAGAFVGATWFPGGPDPGYTVVAGVRLSLLVGSLIGAACLFNDCKVD